MTADDSNFCAMKSDILLMYDVTIWRNRHAWHHYIMK